MVIYMLCWSGRRQRESAKELVSEPDALAGSMRDNSWNPGLLIWGELAKDFTVTSRTDLGA